MSGTIPPWIAELADSGRMERQPAGTEEAAAAERLERLLHAFGQILEPESHNTVDSEGAFTWGHLKVTALLGQGSFGEVYRAFDTTLEREVALKLRHGDASHARSFIAEARRLAQVRHPNVLAVYGAGVHDSRAGLWADLLDGHTVTERVTAHGPLSRPAALALASDLASALAAVHAAGLVHGDVKPSNVMLQADGHAVLMDFGAAAEHATAARFGVTGSPLSMAPEQLFGEPVDTAADMYSLGVVLFFAVRGQHPVEAATLAGLQAAHRDFSPENALKDQTQLPRAFRKLLASWLDPEPDKRPDAPTSLQQLGRIAAAPERRRKRIAVTAIIASLALALVVSLFAIRRIKAEREAAETARAQQAAVSQFLQDTLAAPNPANAGADVRVTEILGIAAKDAERKFAEQPAILMPLLRSIGISYKGLGLDQKAEPLLARALGLSHEQTGSNSAYSLNLELNLAEARRNQRQWSTDEATKVIEVIFDRAKQNLGPRHHVTVAAALELLEWHRGHRQLQEARRYIEFVLAQRPENGTVEQIQRAIALNELGNIEYLSGAYERAIPHFQQALRIAQADPNEYQMQVDAIRNGLAVVMYSQGNLAAAEEQFRALLATSEFFGESHHKVRVAIMNLSSVLAIEHKYEEAEVLMRRYIELQETYAGDDLKGRFDGLSNLAELLAKTGRLSESGTIREQVRTEAVAALGADDPTAIMATSNLATQRILEGDGIAAQPLARETVERSERVFGVDHMFAIEGHELLARARFLRGENTAAIADMATVCARKRDILGSEHFYTLSCMSNRADMLAETGQRDRAVALLKQVVALAEQSLGNDNPSAIDARAHLERIVAAKPE